jgi:hypothetical protein
MRLVLYLVSLSIPRIASEASGHTEATLMRLFLSREITALEKAELDSRGHLLLEGLLTLEARQALIDALSRIAALQAAHERERPGDQTARKYAAEHDTFLASLIAHPDLLGLARSILGPDIRYDHCVVLNRMAADPGMRWHTHEYADADPRLGFLRLFFYVNGFDADDGALKVVPGSHLFRDSRVTADTDLDLQRTWLDGKVHPLTGERLGIERLSAPPGSVIAMWTHALHGVTPRKEHSPMRWMVVYAYRNPGQPSRARWISPEFERRDLPGTEDLMSLY